MSVDNYVSHLSGRSGEPRGLLQKAVVVMQRVLSIREPQHWRNHGSEPSSGECVNETSVLALSAAWACVNLIAGTISTMPLMVYRTARDGTLQVAKDHPLYRLLHDSPNADQTAVDFWEFMAASVELDGNALARKVRIGKKIVSLEPVRWRDTSVRRTDKGAIEYRYTENGKSFVVAQDDMLHIRGFGGTPEGGLSTLSAGRQVFGLAIATDTTAGSTFRHGLRPSVVIKFKSWLTGDQRETVETRLVEKYSGAVNSGRPFLVEGDTDISNLSFNPRDSQMLESRAFSVEEICRMFGVPPVIIGHTSKTTSWPTGVEQQGLILQKFTFRRRFKRIEQALEKQLLTAEDRAAGIRIEFNMEGLLRGDTAQRFASYAIGLQNGIYVINECRAWENLPPVNGGDVPRMQMQNQPITEAAAIDGTEDLPPVKDDEEEPEAEEA